MTRPDPQYTAPTYYSQPPAPAQYPPPPLYMEQPPKRSVAKTRKQTSHGFHLAMTILTGGMWGVFVWLPMTMWHKLGPRRRTVTRYR